MSINNSHFYEKVLLLFLNLTLCLPLTVCSRGSKQGEFRHGSNSIDLFWLVFMAILGRRRCDPGKWKNNLNSNLWLIYITANAQMGDKIKGLQHSFTALWQEGLWGSNRRMNTELCCSVCFDGGGECCLTHWCSSFPAGLRSPDCEGHSISFTSLSDNYCPLCICTCTVFPLIYWSLPFNLSLVFMFVCSLL